MTEEELVGLWAGVLRELRRRQVIRSANTLIADYAETLVARHFGVSLPRRSTSGYDLMANDGTRYQVKARQLLGARGERQLGGIRNLNKDGFDHLIVVLFDEEVRVQEMWRLPIALVRDYAKPKGYDNSHILHASGSVLSDRRAERLR